MNDSNDLADPRLSALLDGELSKEAAAVLTERIDADAGLQAEFDALQSIDAMLGDWYEAAPLAANRVHSAPVAQPAKSRRWMAYAASLAAAVLLVVLGAPVLMQSRARIHAEEAIEKAGSAVLLAKGVSAAYATRIVTHDADGKEDIQEGTGSMYIARLQDTSPWLACAETWAKSDAHIGFERTWGQRDGHQWSRETMGGISMESSSQGSAVEFDDTEKLTGSPVDTRSGQAARGLIGLLRGFSRQKQLQWMNVAWSFSGGKGTQVSPWEYVHDPDDTLDDTEKSGTAAEKIVWNLKIEALNDSIQALELEERVIKRAGGAVVSSQKTKWTITVSNQGFSDDTFAPPAAKDALPDEAVPEEEEKKS